MVVKKNSRRSKSNKKQAINKKQHQKNKVKLADDIGDNVIRSIEVELNTETEIRPTICSVDKMYHGVHKLKATLDNQNSELFEKLNQLPEGFHQSRLSALSSIRCLHVFYDEAPDTFALAVGILDKFLSVIKVKNQHISCVAAACYFIASKVHEEDEDIPLGTGLCQLHGNRWKLPDLCRMEGVILRKLEWKLPLTTYITYLNHFLTILNENYPMIRASCSVEKVIEIAEKYLRFGYSHTFKPSTVALCAFYQYFSQADLLDSVLSVFVMKLQSICAITDSELFECQQLVAGAQNCEPEPIPKSQRVTNNLFSKIRSRPSYYGETDLPTIEEDNTQDTF